MARVTYGGTSGNNFPANWKPHLDVDGNRREVFDAATDYIEGYLVNDETKPSKFEKDSRIFTFRIHPDPASKEEYTGFGNVGEEVSTFGCTVLNDKIDQAVKESGLGTWLRIEYKGQVLKSENAKALKANPNKKFTSNSDFVKLFDVFGDNAIPAIKVEGQIAYTPAASNAAPAATAPRPETPAQSKPAPAAATVAAKSEPAPVTAAAPPTSLPDGDDDEEAPPF